MIYFCFTTTFIAGLASFVFLVYTHHNIAATLLILVTLLVLNALSEIHFITKNKK